MKTIILAREDINNPVHPFLWEQLCEELNVPRDAEMVTLQVAGVTYTEAEATE